MKTDKRKRLSGSSDTPKRRDVSTLSGSHDVTLDSILNGKPVSKEKVEFIFSEYHLTAKIVNSSLTIRELSLLLDVLNYQIVHYGLNLSMLLSLYELYQRCMGNARKSDDISDSRIRLTVSVSEILISDIKDLEFSLYQGEKVQISAEIVKLVLPYLMSKRTYSSRFAHWRPEKFITVKAVPVSTLIERTSTKSKRYSGYCKGYGESHGNAHRFKTKPSIELDGETGLPDKEERNLILRVTDQVHQLSNSLWIKYRNLKQKR